MSTTSKTPATKIEILWSEAAIEPQAFTAWRDVDMVLFAVATSRPRSTGGYYKTGFRITWADGETYEGRIDVQRGTHSIREHVRAHCLAYSGRSAPALYSEAEWLAVVARVKPEQRAGLERVLDNYEL